MITTVKAVCLLYVSNLAHPPSENTLLNLSSWRSLVVTAVSLRIDLFQCTVAVAEGLYTWKWSAVVVIVIVRQGNYTYILLRCLSLYSMCEPHLLGSKEWPLTYYTYGKWNDVSSFTAGQNDVQYCQWCIYGSMLYCREATVSHWLIHTKT